MALTAAAVTDQWLYNTTPGTSVGFGGYTPTADALNVLYTMTYDSGGSPEQPTISGTNGWNETYTHEGGLTFGDFRIDAFSFTAGSSPSSGTITLTTSGTMEGWMASVVAVSPTAGETPEVVSGSFNSGSTSGVTSYSLTTGSPTGVTMGWVVVDEGSCAALTGFTNGSLSASTVNGYYYRTCWDTGSTDPVGFEWNLNAAPGLLVLEVNDAASGPGTSIEAELEAGSEISTSTVDHEVFQNTDLTAGFIIGGQATAGSGGATENIEANLLAGHTLEDGDTLDIYIAGYSDLLSGFILDVSESSVSAENINAELTTGIIVENTSVTQITGNLSAELTTGFSVETDNLVQSISATINAGFSLTASSNLGKVVEDLIREGSDFVDNPKEYVRDSNRDIVKRY